MHGAENVVQTTTGNRTQTDTHNAVIPHHAYVEPNTTSKTGCFI
jgi:hypothetical protein